MSKNELNKGINIIKKISRDLPKKSGIYKMLSFNNEILYYVRICLVNSLICYIRRSLINNHF